MAALAYKYERLQSSNYSDRSNFSDYTGEITHICIHHWGGDGQRHSTPVNWLRGANGGTSNTGSSAHYVISADLVSNLVAEDKAAWAAVGANGYAIHLELRPEMSQGDWDTAVQVCCNIEERRGSMKYMKHEDVASTACPGRWANQLGNLIKDINAEHRRRGNDPKDPRRKAGATSTPKPHTPKPKPAAKSSGYSGPSIVEYLRSVGQPHSYSHRAKLAQEHGISGYRGTARQNTALLNKLRGGGSLQRKSIATMASEVMRGDHGNGHAERRASLGISSSLYKDVRAEVNRRYRA